jgi:membrane protein DedA with SNARE-associated domain
MQDWVNGFVEEVSHWNPLWGYLAVALSAFLENVIPPVPGDTVVVFSAYLVGLGLLHWAPVYAATCVGGTAGFMLMYQIGRTGGRALVGRSGNRLFGQEQLIRAEAWLERYGSWLILANRFLSGVRSVIALAAGLGNLSWPRVFVLGGISMILWNGALLYAGMLVGRNWESVIEVLRQYNQVAVGIVIVVLLGLVLRGWRQRRRS